MNLLHVTSFGPLDYLLKLISYPDIISNSLIGEHGTCNKLTFMGISAMTRLLLSSMFLRVITSPPTTTLITIPSAHVFTYSSSCHEMQKHEKQGAISFEK
jgi:hypothetical protein